MDTTYDHHMVWDVLFRFDTLVCSVHLHHGLVEPSKELPSYGIFSDMLLSGQQALEKTQEKPTKSETRQ